MGSDRCFGSGAPHPSQKRIHAPLCTTAHHEDCAWAPLNHALHRHAGETSPDMCEMTGWNGGTWTRMW